MGSHYEISPREREDEQRRHRDEFDAPEETYWEYLARTTQFDARLSETPKAGGQTGAAPASSTPGTGVSESRDKDAA